MACGHIYPLRAPPAPAKACFRVQPVLMPVSQAIAGAGGGTHTTHAVGTGRHFLIEVSGTGQGIPKLF